MYVFMLTERNQVLDRLKQGKAQSRQTSDNSGDETNTSKAPQDSVEENFSFEKDVKGKRVWQVLCDNTPPISQAICTVGCAAKMCQS